MFKTVQCTVFNAHSAAAESHYRYVTTSNSNPIMPCATAHHSRQRAQIAHNPSFNSQLTDNEQRRQWVIFPAWIHHHHHFIFFTSLLTGL